MDQLLPDSELQDAVAEIDGLDSTAPTHEAAAGVEELEGSPPATATEWISRGVSPDIHATLAELSESAAQHGITQQLVRADGISGLVQV